MINRFDHVFSFIKGNNLDATLERMKRAGFLLADQKVRHPAGHLNGFVRMMGSYLEFISIVDEAEYERDTPIGDRPFREKPQIFGIGAVASDIQAVHDRLIFKYPEINPPYSRGRADLPNSPPLWTFCKLPPESLPGAFVFALKYHNARTEELQVGPNRIFALGGLYFCTSAALERTERWRSTMRDACVSVEIEEGGIGMGFQTFHWIAPERYEELFGEEWAPVESSIGEVAAAILLTDDIETSISFLEANGFNVGKRIPGGATFKKDLETGYAFVLKSVDLAVTQSRILEALNKS